ncbi:MAG: CbtB-domain containing protein [Candidatus Lambdaproteobacteria bacterium]|nr:CbtB-domain containing protein [Candidatus Lambdaproteobacteria bacterium]
MTAQTAQYAASRAGAGAAAHLHTLAAALGAIALGALLLAGVALAHSAVLHDSAHDARHGISVPCH